MTTHDVHAMSGAARHRLREELALLQEPISPGWARLIGTITHHHYDEHIPELDSYLEKQ